MLWMILEYRTHRLWGPYASFDLALKQLEDWVEVGFLKPSKVTLKPVVDTTPESHRETQMSLLRKYHGSEVCVATLDGEDILGYLHCTDSSYVWVGEVQVTLDSISDVRCIGAARHSKLAFAS